MKIAAAIKIKGRNNLWIMHLENVRIVFYTQIPIIIVGNVELPKDRDSSQDTDEVIRKDNSYTQKAGQK